MAGKVAIIAQNQSPKIDVLEVDAFISETHTGENDVTEHPVEEGADITDHVRAKPESLAVEGIVTNSPIRRPTVTNSGGENPVESAIDFLRRLRKSGRPVTVVSGIIVYDKMVLVALAIPRDARLGQAVRFSCNFKEIITVQSETVKLERVNPDNAKGKLKDGKQHAEAADEDTKKKSLLSKADDAFFGGEIKKWTQQKLHGGK